MFEDLLFQRCTIHRGTQADVKNYVPGDIQWTVVATDIHCRADFLANRQRSRFERTTEEITGRSVGTLFIAAGTPVKERDIVTISGDQFDDKEYDIMYVDPVSSFNEVHHYEAVIHERDNKALP